MKRLLLRGNSIGSVKGVLFDKDGTLSNSEKHLQILAELRVQEALRIFNISNRAEKEVCKLKKMLWDAYGLTTQGLNPAGTIAVASRNQNLIATATVFSLLGESWPDSLQLANEIFRTVDHIENGIELNLIERTLLPGAKEILIKLKNANTIQALISNDTEQGLKRFLRENNLNESIDNIWSADHSPSKPDPEAVISLCNVLGLKPEECALIGDAESDLRMAKKAGIKICIGFTGGWTGKAKLSSHQYLIQHWNELDIE